jgi:hypothetical protein
MIVYHKNHEIDREQWDNCIRNSSCTRPYAWSWYLDIMAPGWEALVDDDYDSVFPVPSAARLGIRYIATPVFVQQLGAFSPDKPQDEVIVEFLDYLPEFYRFIDLNIAQKIEIDGFRVTELPDYELDLAGPYDVLNDKFSVHCRRNVESSVKKGTVLVNDATPDELISLFLNNKGKLLKGIKPGDYLRLRNLMSFCLKNHKGRIIGARNGRGKLIYGVFVVETAGRKTMLFVVNTYQSREKRIGYFAVNELIRENAGSKVILDFAGSSIPDVATFMQSFGATMKPYYRIYRNSLFWPLRMLK